MATRNPYSNLRFEKQVDWKDVDPVLLRKVNAIARSRGEIVDVFSGYRSPAYNKKVGGAQDSQHTHGKAIDAYVNGQPIGEVWPSAVFQQAGLRSGNQPNFFNGKPDPEHVDLGAPGGGADSTIPDQGTPASSPPTAGDQIASDLSTAAPPPTAPTVGVNVAQMPGTALLSPEQKPQYETWQALAALPGASPDTMRLSQLASLGQPDAASA